MSKSLEKIDEKIEKVITYKDVVQLSGFVDTAEMKARAGTVASRVAGVSSVKNDLVVK